MDGNVWRHRYGGPPLKWWQALLFCAVLLAAFALFLALLLCLAWLISKVISVFSVLSVL